MASKKSYTKVESSLPAPWSPVVKGEQIEGQFLGALVLKAKPRKGQPAGTFESYRFRLTEPVESIFGPKGSPKSKKVPGDVIAVSGGMLSSRMDQVPTGADCRVTYNGMITTQNGEAKDWQVEVAENTDLLDPYAATGE